MRIGVTEFTAPIAMEVPDILIALGLFCNNRATVGYLVKE